jgi:hypothetical protein
MSNPVELHIEELVLHDVDPRDRWQVADAVQRELTRLLAAGPLAPALGRSSARPEVDAGSFAAPPGRDARTLGAGIARAVHAGIVR